MKPLNKLPEIMNRIQNAEKLCIFGLGVLVQETHRQMQGILGRKPDFYCDNDRDKWGREFNGKLCVSPAQLAEYQDRVCVIIAVKQYESVWTQLMQLGLKNLIVANFDRGYHVRNFFQPEGILAHPAQSAYGQLKGRWAFVTGSSRGIGQRIAVELSKLGCNLILHGRKLSHLELSESLCRGQGVEVELFEAELEDLKAVDRMLESILALPNRVEIVVNNAAVSPAYPDGVWSVSTEEVQRIFSINTFTPVRVIQTLVPPMVAGGFGRVLNVTTHIQFRPHEMIYTMSKAALDSYSREMVAFLNKIDLPDFSLTSVDPGWVKTDAGGPEAKYDVETIVPGILLGIILGPEFHGHCFNAQDFKHLSVAAAVDKAKRHLQDYGFGEWI
ncbi:MAG TPA: hypothetical protein DHU63_05930 [Candidatus Marinimicrobia bacterium]|nr:hypothetical protein [Candidatus Neomarinimicrobiota bacterium]